VQDCYAVLGLLHSIWRPVPGRIKDFIAMPRPNLYQSLHTTVIARKPAISSRCRSAPKRCTASPRRASPRTGSTRPADNVTPKDEQRLAWVRQFVEWQREMSDPNEFMSTLKIDLYPEEVYTFTPKGKVVVLPKDASPIDFAYTIHTQVGNTTTGAKVNGRMVPLRTKLRTGDIVEITTQAGHKPSRDWLSFTKSSRARNKIKHWLNEHQRERAVEVGRKLLEREARKFKVPQSQITTRTWAAGRQRVWRGYAGRSAGRPGAGQALRPPFAQQAGARLTNCNRARRAGDQARRRGGHVRRGAQAALLTGSDSLQVEGQNDLLVYRARCCNPIRGEEIVGYVTRGKGVAVHARGCPNVQNLLYESDRRINVEWSRTVSPAGRPQRYPVKITVSCDDHPGMLKELIAVLSDDNSNISGVDIRKDENGEAVVELITEAEDVGHLNRMVLGLRRVPGVRAVQRTQKL
jgi:guanosine-3',5'-bis(diphosphate) 3'-pyrophosphohydrolase